MPFVVNNPANIAQKVTDANTLYLQTSLTRVNTAKYMLDNYNFNGTSPMVSVSWDAPDGSSYNFDPGVFGAGFSYNTNPYFSLTTIQKRSFFRYFDKFVGQILKYYNEFYSL